MPFPLTKSSALTLIINKCYMHWALNCHLWDAWVYSTSLSVEMNWQMSTNTSTCSRLGVDIMNLQQIAVSSMAILYPFIPFWLVNSLWPFGPVKYSRRVIFRATWAVDYCFLEEMYMYQWRYNWLPIFNSVQVWFQKN